VERHLVGDDKAGGTRSRRSHGRNVPDRRKRCGASGFLADLPAALSAYCGEFSKLRGIPISYKADESVDELSPGAALCIYRIAQEALGNVAKHAKAGQVEVRLSRSNGNVCPTMASVLLPTKNPEGWG
jgi:hypothetical protein